MPKPSSIRSSVSIEHRLVTDRQTDTGPWLAPRSIASRGKNLDATRPNPLQLTNLTAWCNQILYSRALNALAIQSFQIFVLLPTKPSTRGSAIAEGPRDASCQLKSCQLPRNRAETTCTTSPEPSISCC